VFWALMLMPAAAVLSAPSAHGAACANAVPLRVKTTSAAIVRPILLLLFFIRSIGRL
jgi:hypothetical protein